MSGKVLEGLGKRYGWKLCYFLDLYVLLGKSSICIYILANKTSKIECPSKLHSAGLSEPIGSTGSSCGMFDDQIENSKPENFSCSVEIIMH